MSRAVASFSQIHLKQSLLQLPTATTHVSFGGAQIKNPIFLSQTRARPNAATVPWAVAPATESLYETLGISEDVTSVEIKKAYKQLARTFHPDASRDPERVDEFTRKFIRIQEAYETLSDPKARAMYDRDMAAGLAFNFGARKNQGVGFDERGDWKRVWQCQLDGLLRKSNTKRNSTWGATMRTRP